MEVLGGGGRFTVRRVLGRGGMGVVFVAYDRERQSEVALKTVARLDASALYLFKREFRALADVRHRNLVSLYELGSQEDEWFFTMELLDGVDLLSHVRGDLLPEAQQPQAQVQPEAVDHTQTRLPELTAATVTSYRDLVESMAIPTSGPRLLRQPADEGRVRDAFGQLVEGLVALHSSGHLHRDIKPPNVQVTSEGRVVVLDFGVIATVQHSGGVANTGVVGTPAYMAPEQALSTATITEASDWYSVGVMLYEALAGKRPFDGLAGELIRQKRSCQPESPRSLQPGVSAELSELCMALLSVEPSDRPTAEAIREALQASGSSTGSRRVPAVPTGDSVFVGRERELAVLHEAMNASIDGVGTVLYVSGRSGMGKSSLVHHFLEQVRQLPRSAVLEGRCYQQETVPYKAVDTVVDALCDLLMQYGDEAVTAALPADIALLARLFPVLKRVRLIAVRVRDAADESIDAHEVRRRAFRALRELLCAIASDRPMVVYIDDLQWGDVDSAPLLDGLMRAPGQPALLLVASFRSEERAQSALLQQLFDREQLLGEGSVARELPVDALGDEHGAALVRLLAADSEVELDAEQIVRDSEGHPYFIYELVRHAMSGGRHHGQAKLTLDGMIAQRVGQLTESAQRVLELVAVAAHPIEQEVLDVAAGLAPKERIDLARALQGERLVRTSGLHGDDSIESFHDRIRETVAGSLSEPERRSRHRSLADALDMADAEPDRLVFHYRAAGEPDIAAPHAARAADHAVETLAFAKAAELYQFALTTFGDQHRLAPNLKVQLADALSNAGRGEQAASAYLAAAQVRKGNVRTELQIRGITEYILAGYIDRGMALVQEVLRGVGLRRAHTRLGTLLSFLWYRGVLRLRGRKFRPREESELSPEVLCRIDTCYALGAGFAFVDSIFGAHFATLQTLHSLRAGEPTRVLRSLAYEIISAAMWGARSVPRVRAMERHVRTLAGELTNEKQRETSNALIELCCCVGAVLRGDWQASISHADIAIPLLRTKCTGVWWQLTVTEYFRVMSLAYVGRLADMRDDVKVLLAEARDRGDVYAHVSFTAGVPNLSWLMAGRVDEARRHVDEAVEGWTQEGFHLQHYWAHQAYANIEIYEGNGEAAHDRWLMVHPRMRKALLLWISGPRFEALHTRGRCAIACAAANPSRRDAFRIAVRSARGLARMKLPNTRAMDAMLRANLAMLQKDDDDAVAAHRRAEQATADAGLVLYNHAVRCRLGELVGGQEGEELIAASDRFFTEQGVAEPERFAGIFMPAGLAHRRLP